MPLNFLNTFVTTRRTATSAAPSASRRRFSPSSVVTTVSVDLGPLVRERAETLGRNTWKRPIHIGSLSIRLLTGRIQVENFSIEGLQPDDRPFFTARRLDVSLDWSTAFDREITITAVDMTDWQMLVEKWDDRQQLPEVHRRRRRPAARPEALHDDVEVPAGVARPVHVRRSRQRRGASSPATSTSTSATCRSTTARPPSPAARWRFSTTCRSRRRCEPASPSTTAGSTSIASSSTPTARRPSRPASSTSARWPEQTYQFKSRVQFPRMRQLFFKDETWELTGEGDFTGTFHLFKNGRDLAGTFASAALGVNEYRFPGLYGSLHWTPTALDVDQRGRAGVRRRRALHLLDSAARRRGPTHGQVRGEFCGRGPRVVHRLPAAQGTPLRGHRQRRAGAAGMAAGTVLRPSGRAATWSSTPPAGVQPMTASLAAVAPGRTPIARRASGGRLHRLPCRGTCRSPAS